MKGKKREEGKRRKNKKKKIVGATKDQIKGKWHVNEPRSLKIRPSKTTCDNRLFECFLWKLTIPPKRGIYNIFWDFLSLLLTFHQFTTFWYCSTIGSHYCNLFRWLLTNIYWLIKIRNKTRNIYMTTFRCFSSFLELK